MSSTIWFCCVIFLLSANRLDAFLNFAANCAPRPTVIRIEQYPFFILLHRCNGSCISHASVQNSKCSETTSHEVNIRVLDRHNGGGHKFIPMQNHTSCGCGCVSAMNCQPVLEKWVAKQCRCQCNYPNAPPKDLACKPDFKWDKTTCRCQCDIPRKTCSPGKHWVWNTESCGCVCSTRIINRCARKQMGLDHEKCECVDAQALRSVQKASVNSKAFITVIILLALLIAILVCVIIRMAVKSKRPQRHNPLTRSDSGNISCSNGSAVCESAPSSNTKAAKYQTHSNGSVCLSSS